MGQGDEGCQRAVGFSTASWIVPAPWTLRIEERYSGFWQRPANGLEDLVAERLLISIWLTSENRDGHSLWRIRRDGIKHMLVSLVKAPAIDDQALSKGGQHLFIYVRQVVTSANRSDLLMTGSLANKHGHIVPGRPPPGYGAKQVTCASRAYRKLCLVTKVVTSNRKTAVRVEN